MTKSPSRPLIDTLYPVSPEGEAYKGAVPAPLGSELQRRLSDIGAQDVGPQ